MGYIIISDKNLEYEEWIGKSLEIMAEHKITGIAICCLLDPAEEDACLSGYWNMGQVDVAYAATHFMADSIDQMIRDNLERYAELYMHPEEDESPQ